MRRYGSPRMTADSRFLFPHPPLYSRLQRIDHELPVMSKNQRKLNKANHGKRPASSKARREKRKMIKT